MGLCRELSFGSSITFINFTTTASFFFFFKVFSFNLQSTCIMFLDIYQYLQPPDRHEEKDAEMRGRHTNSHGEIGMLERKLVVAWSVPKSTDVVYLSNLFSGVRDSPSEYIT